MFGMNDSIAAASPRPHPGTVAEVFWVFLRLGVTSFGGPVAHLGYFREAFVARQQWLGEWPEQVEQLVMPLAESGKLDLQALLRELGQRGINELWVEAGRQLAGALVAQQLVDELIVYLAPKVLGDTAQGLLAPRRCRYAA